MTITSEVPKVKMETFNQYESEVRSYSRSFPTVFTKAKGYKLWDTDEKEYIDFFAGAGTLNYGHNNDAMKTLLIDYIEKDSITHSLDMATVARGTFLQKFNDIILQPRNLDYKVMFPGPTGTNAVESALKLARKKTGRTTIMSFTNAFHGMTIGSLSITGNESKRKGAGIPLAHSISMPFDQYNAKTDSLSLIESYLENGGSGIDLPAGIIVETVQGEGGINAASDEWLKGIEKIAKKFGILLIVDDIQAGCGRTGTFFSFERAGIEPDIVCLSKSIGGYGLPMALTLFKKELDIWEPGEHNGTFRGNNLAFVAATEALSYWETDTFAKEVEEKADLLSEFIRTLVKKYPELKAEPRGRGLMQGVACQEEGIAEKICHAAFERGLLMETSGPKDEVFKFLPPLIIDKAGLQKGFQIIEDSLKTVLKIN
ncbi:diaminobutyrate--2-oxoglutarate transaminase [Pseudogracilibacillus auburnensis]|uniref:Diaminobutyrate--2-oxoglutarate transaminase n=1 Tax=Pseudogracilibacillus auburnensis TaxID=1494959 RepID=A0A2V3W894_9BACI|nr:diaminobutyrate--2-oxoglutarate transaminase [Pseudogracilibacillus auburnensis]MBO1003647.1 diaminobutyrate--2-oxoglutarate transaminase [Pseudogracilibacillus auburnensis]PXW90342.1 diaminobutyrate aminotransferase [Pseudogracilibacillus auburnensis]